MAKSKLYIAGNLSCVLLILRHMLCFNLTSDAVLNHTNNVMLLLWTQNCSVKGLPAVFAFQAKLLALTEDAVSHAKAPLHNCLKASFGWTFSVSNSVRATQRG